MKTKLMSLPLASLALALVSCQTVPPEIPTVPLGDAVINFAREAKRAGAKELKYTAVVTVGNEVNGSIAVPIGGVAPSIGGNVTHSASSTVEITVPIESTAAKSTTGKKFMLNTSTHALRQVQ